MTTVLDLPSDYLTTELNPANAETIASLGAAIVFALLTDSMFSLDNALTLHGIKQVFETSIPEMSREINVLFADLNKKNTYINKLTQLIEKNSKLFLYFER
jgi:hypothetical protein